MLKLPILAFINYILKSVPKFARRRGSLGKAQEKIHRKRTGKLWFFIRKTPHLASIASLSVVTTTSWYTWITKLDMGLTIWCCVDFFASAFHVLEWINLICAKSIFPIAYCTCAGNAHISLGKLLVEVPLLFFLLFTPLLLQSHLIHLSVLLLSCSPSLTSFEHICFKQSSRRVLTSSSVSSSLSFSSVMVDLVKWDQTGQFGIRQISVIQNRPLFVHMYEKTAKMKFTVRLCSHREKSAWVLLAAPTLSVSSTCHCHCWQLRPWALSTSEREVEKEEEEWGIVYSKTHFCQLDRQYIVICNISQRFFDHAQGSTAKFYLLIYLLLCRFWGLKPHLTYWHCGALEKSCFFATRFNKRHSGSCDFKL